MGYLVAVEMDRPLGDLASWMSRRPGSPAASSSCRRRSLRGARRSSRRAPRERRPAGPAPRRCIRLPDSRLLSIAAPVTRALASAGGHDSGHRRRWWAGDPPTTAAGFSSRARSRRPRRRSPRRWCHVVPLHHDCTGGRLQVGPVDEAVALDHVVGLVRVPLRNASPSNSTLSSDLAAARIPARVMSPFSYARSRARGRSWPPRSLRCRRRRAGCRAAAPASAR